MGFEFKHFVFLTAMACAVWAMGLSSLIAYDDLTASVAFKSELPSETAAVVLDSTPFHVLEKFRAVAQTLNVVLPLGALCIAFLIYTYSLNPVGLGALTVLVAAFLFGTISVVDAGNAVEQVADVDISELVWWMRG